MSVRREDFAYSAQRGRAATKEAVNATVYNFSASCGEVDWKESNDVMKIKPNDRAMDYWETARLIDWAAGRKANEKTKETLREDISDVAAKLAGPTPSPIERMLADIAATCWFAYRLHEAQYADNVTSEGMSFAQSEHAQRRIDRAHRRFLNTIKTLATVRRLAVPAVQINVARQQVNQVHVGDPGES